MAMDFPSSPTVGQTVYNNGLAYTWNGTTWSTQTARASSIRQTFTAGAGQTSFTVTNGYFPGTIDVYKNGTKLVPSAFTATNGTTITLTVGATAGDIIEVVSFNSFSVVNINAAAITTGSLAAARIDDASLSGAKITNTTLAVAKINATGTASASTFLRGDGAWQAPAASGVTSITAGTGLSGGTITTTGTIALVTTAGAVGTYGFFKTLTFATQNPGATLAGSSLQWASADGQTSATSPSGTWQCMGFSRDNCAGPDQLTTLWIRIA